MGFASWLLGAATTGSGIQLAGPASLQPYHGAYIQDSYKVTSKLTLNYGVRWDFEPPRSERHDRQFYWDENYVWPWTPTAGWSWNEAMQTGRRGSGDYADAALDHRRHPRPACFDGDHGLSREDPRPKSHPDHFSPRVRSCLRVPSSHRAARILWHQLDDRNRQPVCELRRPQHRIRRCGAVQRHQQQWTDLSAHFLESHAGRRRLRSVQP